MKVFLESIGCRLNLSEIEKIAAGLRNAGHEIVGNSSDADLAIVNTCAVTSSAGADSRKSIRRIATSGCEQIFVTGCYATVAPESVRDLPSVVNLYGNDKKTHITTDLIEIFQSGLFISTVREPLPGKNHRTRAFIKVQDGCDNHCTFCLTRIARGKSVSQSENEIFNDVETALKGGVKEIVLTGVNLGSWGKDLGDGFTLPKLIYKIINRYSPNRIRLSSLEPWDIDRSYFSVFKHPSFCRHLHLPLQSGSDAVLKKMGRKILTDDYKKLVQNIRKDIPDMAITTDVMVGFSGESEKDFLDSISFIEDIKFSGGHVFRYSPRPGTPAEKMDGIVPEKEKHSRSKKMRDVFADSEHQYKKGFIDRNLSVLWEKAEKQEDGKHLMDGLTSNYMRVVAVAYENKQNMISEVKILSIQNNHLNGRIIS
ncbi:MAG: tRNA (N(6)-L-threonylcarbamoyladenosine(37)-C(2))-methylthiotransferase MtaB [Candidatus Lokiarchaeota archaeon]|nr:tRNA (N(6)-L-threonylcarbamoyladenosine(37)-C(2))-methylthiotransferase MtaB [Candidatus Lokiarchaeota archaeon]